MEKTGDEARAVEAAITWIQRVAVKKLNLDSKPADIDPDLEFKDVEVIRYGDAETLDSIDLVDVIAVLEDRFEVDLLEDDEFREAGFTIRCMATFLVSRFGPKRVRKVARSRR